MTFKKKTVISVTTICLTFVFALASVIVIFALNNLSVTTNISITYQSTVAGAEYSFGYRNSDDAGTSFTYLNQSVAIDSQGDDNKEPFATTGISASQVELGEDNKFFILYWQIKNTGDEPFKATLTYTDGGDTDTGLTITKFSEISTTTLTDFTTINQPVSLGNQTYVSTIAVGKGEVLHVYVKVELASVAKNAIYTGDFAWNLVNETVTQ